MFSFSTGKAAYPPIYNTRNAAKQDSPACSADSLDPAMDGPPSPERIRAYTEQMKRSSIFGNNSRTNTLSSATSSSFRSRTSPATSTDNLSRKSSGRSSGLPSPRDRSESSQKFGSIFSRSGRKSRRDTSLGNSALSFTVKEGTSEEDTAAGHYHGNGSRRGGFRSAPPLTHETRRFPSISEPFNFQHVTHTRQDHLPDLVRSSRMELVSEFSALRASQAPTNGGLKEIKTQDLHFDNFSSEALVSAPPEEPLNTSPPRQRRGSVRKSSTPPQRATPFAKSHDNLRVAPPRPSRSSLSPACPISLPPRTSSRAASVLLDTFDSGATPKIQRPHTAHGSFDHALQMGHQEHITQTLDALASPGDEAWPLTAPSNGSFGVELTDVQEEEEEAGTRQARASRASSELKKSQSVPSLQLKAYEQVQTKRQTRTSTILLPASDHRTSVLRKSPLSPGFRFDHDSWEQDIDYCYEHEIEADCEYEWDRCSVEHQEEETIANATNPQPQLDLHLEDDDRSIYHGRFRPSLIVPSAYEVPELSPMSNSSTPRSPAAFLQPNPARASYASSFKESHGFNLSPSLLIPADFRSQMEQESLYSNDFTKESASAAVFVHPETYGQSMSSLDETSSSINSYRSSGFSRGSARSSSSTRLSATSHQAHRSVGSLSSIPDLVPFKLGKIEAKQNLADLDHSNAALNRSDADFGSIHRRPESLAGSEPGVRKSHAATENPPVARLDIIDGNSTLSPVAESFIDTNEVKSQGQVHGRKISAPVVSQSPREYKGRARASTLTTAGGRKKGGYMLFPQI